MKRMLRFFGKSSTRDLDEPPDPVEAYKKKGKKSDIMIYNALDVTDFSSQYGSETSISYTAANLAARGSIYPNYGDFTQACVFRTYGPWWDMVPSSRKPFTRTPPWFCSQDYIEISFQTKVYPLKLEIYETYNPGCIVRILACEGDTGTDVDSGSKLNRWKTLWEGQPTMPGLISRCFCPPLKSCPFPTDLMRLELCHHYVHYYTELDYVALYGIRVAEDGENKEGSASDNLTPAPPQYHSDDERSVDGTVEQLRGLYLSTAPKSPTHTPFSRDTSSDQSGPHMGKNIARDDHISHSGGSTSEETHRQFMSSSEVVGRQSSDDDDTCLCIGGSDGIDRQTSEEFIETDNGYFDRLPEEVIQLILSFLDMFSLCRVARTCRLFHKHSYDSLQYTELNLQPHWTQVTNLSLDSLQSRCQHLQRLNLSWCHGNIVTHEGFSRFMEACGRNLCHLYLSSCSFLTSESMTAIAQHCPNLTELDLSSCKQIESHGLFHLHTLVHLQALNLYRTAVDNLAMLAIIRACPELRHLNIGSCICVTQLDNILVELAHHCRELVSIDVWRCKNVTDVGIKALAANCHQLEELDLGWCPDLKSGSKFVMELAQNCPKLKKLFLTANRTVCDNDILALAKYSPNLEQLDILGTRQVSIDSAHAVLQNCQKLVFFDVSFCSGIDNYTVKTWSRNYPNVAIKKSFQN